MILGLIIVVLVLMFMFIIVACIQEEDFWLWLIFGLIFFIIAGALSIFGCFHGFINHPATEGTHQGVITAVDLEGIYFRRYEVYLKSSGYTEQSDETKYLIYDYETELAEQLKEAIGKMVKLNYGHNGGYIAWNSCGTYHIKNFEIVEE